MEGLSLFQQYEIGVISMIRLIWVCILGLLITEDGLAANREERPRTNPGDEIIEFIGSEADEYISINPSSSLHLKTVLGSYTYCMNQNKVTCNHKCEHAKVKFADGCCRCVCKKGHAYRNNKCERAHWGSWTSWSECIKSEWGGLQYKERTCYTRSGIAHGACIGNGSQSKSCSAVTGVFRVRKNIKDLSDQEFHDFLQAYIKFKADKGLKGFENIISWHGWPGRCPWYHSVHADNHCSWHHHPLFLHWHRLIMVQIELGMSRFLNDKTIGFPYWDWTENRKQIPRMLTSPKIYDPILKKFFRNPFVKSKIQVRLNGKLKQAMIEYTHRIPWNDGVLMYKYLLKGSVRALLSRNYYTFDEQLSSNPHDQIHDCFCYIPIDECSFGMPTVEYAAWDPMFAFHHSAMDRILVMRRKVEELKNVQDWTEGRIIGDYSMKPLYHLTSDLTHAWELPMSPFSNSSMNPEQVTLRSNVATLHRSHYQKELFGYVYDNFDLGHYKWTDLVADYDHNTGDHYWHDFKLYSISHPSTVGILTKRNSILATTGKTGCVKRYSNPKPKIKITL